MIDKAMLNDDVLHYIHQSVLCWLATVDADGAPNVSPKEIFAAYDDRTVLIANIASPTSVRNIRTNPTVCLSFIDVFIQKGYKLKGLAEFVPAIDVRFKQLQAPLLEMTKGILPIHGIIAIQVQSIESIFAPSYRLIEDTTEATQISNALSAYGVKKI